MSLHPISNALRFNDVAAAEAFYVQKLGFEVSRRHPGNLSLSRGPGVSLMLESASAGHFGQHYNELIRSRAGTPGAGALYVHAPDVLELHAKLSSDTDVRIVDELLERPWGQTEFTVEDSEGNFVTLYQSTSALSEKLK